jgi:hypothetical protein
MISFCETISKGTNTPDIANADAELAVRCFIISAR